MEVRILGPVEVLVHGSPLRLAKRQHRLIIGVLGLEVNRPVRSDRLIELLWADRPPSRPRAVLHSRVSELRAGLYDRQRYGAACARHQERRVRTFASRRTASTRTASGSSSPRTGRPGRTSGCATCCGRPSPVVRSGTGRLSPTGPQHSLCYSLESAGLTAVEDLHEVELRLGNHQSIVDEMIAQSAANPTRDRLTAALMLALHWAGRTAEVVAVYRQRSAWLRAEYGVDLGPSLQRLHVAILRYDATVARGDPAPCPGD